MTTKLIAALLPSADLDPSSHWDSLVQRLRDAGAERVQVNVDDEAVADAMLRLTTRADAVRTVISVWTPDAEAALAVLAPVADVYEVEERRRLEPPAAPYGEAEPWLSNLALLRRPAAMEHPAWLAYWMDHHTQIAIDTQDTHGYVQNIVVATLTDHPGRAADSITGIVEELFLPGAKTDFHVFYGSGGDEDELRRRMTEMGRSVQQFGASENLDLVPSTRRVFDFAEGPTSG
ncbi:MAG: hypothetical protein ACI379_11085 [Nocardioides sp.]|uniref:hypothetical protein n=1 Tax=Nocardioides sp. TaxID=35761 RepID=UPI003F12A5F0